MLRVIKPVMQQIRLLTGLNMDGKTRNIRYSTRFCTRCTFLLSVSRYLPESGKFLLVESGIRNPEKSWNPESWVLES